jgi:hypothetical protein
VERIGDEASRALARAGGGQGEALAAITRVWPIAVGDAISRNAWPQRIGRDGTLHVATSSSTWAFELDRMSTELAERLAATLGEKAPAALRFRPGPIPEPPGEAPAEKAAEQHEASPETTAAAAELAARIDDSDLRKLVERAARASLHKSAPEPGSDRGFW